MFKIKILSIFKVYLLNKQKKYRQIISINKRAKWVYWIQDHYTNAISVIITLKYTYEIQFLKRMPFIISVKNIILINLKKMCKPLKILKKRIKLY